MVYLTGLEDKLRGLGLGDGAGTGIANFWFVINLNRNGWHTPENNPAVIICAAGEKQTQWRKHPRVVGVGEVRQTQADRLMCADAGTDLQLAFDPGIRLQPHVMTVFQ